MQRSHRSPQKIIASALLLNALLFGLVFAQSSDGNKNNTIYGAVNGDEYFVGNAFFQGVTLPDNLDGTTGSSTYDFKGNGTVTVASQYSGGFPRMVLNAGGTITSTRTFESGDVNHEWWEGYFYAPGLGSTNINITGSNSTNGEDIARFVVEGAFELGDSNESFSFSPSAIFVAKVGRAVSEGTKLYVASKSADGSEYAVSSEYCWVEDGFCAVEMAAGNSFALVREVFSSCPRRNEVLNGSISGVPSCLLTCDKGFQFQDPEVRRYCVATDSGAEGFGDEEFFEEQVPQEELLPSAEPAKLSEKDAVVYPAGYVRHRETRAGYDRKINLEGLSGKDLSRSAVINVSSLKTVRDDQPSGDSGKNLKVDPDRDNFLNYILALRGTGNKKDVAQVASIEASSNELPSSDTQSNESLYGSAPLLPSTGSGMLWILAAVGIALMSFAAVRRN